MPQDPNKQTNKLTDKQMHDFLYFAGDFIFK